MSSEPLTIAIDFGGVLSTHDRGGNNSGAEHANVAINIEGALEGLKSLKQAGHKLILNSFCGKRRAIETAKSINELAPGLFDQLFFVKSKDFKKHVCTHVGADVLIDDTMSILVDVAKNEKQPKQWPPIHLIHFTGDPGFTNQGATKIRNIIQIASWSEVVKFCSSIKPSHSPVEVKNLSEYVYQFELAKDSSRDKDDEKSHPSE
jgi:hypothetical protein